MATNFKPKQKNDSNKCITSTETEVKSAALAPAFTPVDICVRLLYMSPANGAQILPVF